MPSGQPEVIERQDKIIIWHCRTEGHEARMNAVHYSPESVVEAPLCPICRVPMTEDVKGDSHLCAEGCDHA